MKRLKNTNRFKSPMGLLLVVLCFIGCSKEPEKNLPRPEYFQCKINGVDFNPVRAFQCENIKGYYENGPIADTVASEFYSAVGYDCPSGKGVTVKAHNLINGSDEVFQLNDSIHFITASYYDLEKERDEVLYEAISGNFKFTKVVKPYKTNGTPVNGYVVGTFDFVAVNSQHDTVRVTNGKFDVTFPL